MAMGQTVVPTGAMVAELQLQRHGPRHDVLDLVSEHWFDRIAGRDAAVEAGRATAVVVLTGWAEGGQEMRRGLASGEAAKMRAEALAQCFVRDRFPGLVLMFEFGRMGNEQYCVGVERRR